MEVDVQSFHSEILDEVVTEEGSEQSRKNAPQKPYRLSPGQDLESRGSGGLLSQSTVHAVVGMELAESSTA